MNYRHAYHAGNFGDVLKHAVLILVLAHLRAKSAPFFVLDTHAGASRYDLSGPEAARTGEWRDGIGRIYERQDLPSSLVPYRDAVARANHGGALTTYPGSPKLARAALRKNDRMAAIELHPDDARFLKRAFAGDPQVQVKRMDGFQSLKALLPPTIRRGLVIVDPAFEEKNEFSRLAKAVADGVRRWATASYLIWYPVKDTEAVAGFRTAMAELPVKSVLCAELAVAPATQEGSLTASGLMILNPPWTLEVQLREMLPFLASILAKGESAWTLEWLVAEGANTGAQ